MRILALEASTSNVKALLYSSADGVLRTGEHPYSQETCVGRGMHDADAVFRQLTMLGCQVLDGDQVDAVSLSVTWHSLLLCEKEGKPASPVYLWDYPGAEPVCREIRKDPDLSERLYRQTGAIVNPCYPLYKLIWLRQQGTPLEKMQIRGIGSYLFWKFTGKWAVLDSMASGTGLFCISKKSWDDELLAGAKIRESQLSEIVPYTRTSPLNQETADLLGIRSGVPVIPAAGDGGLDQIGADAMGPGIMTMSVGTSGSLRMSTLETPRFSRLPSTWCYLSPVGTWLSGIGTSGCCNCVEWIRKRVYGDRVTYGEIETTLQEKTYGPIFMPFLFGERGPEWAAKRKGSFQGIEAEHTGADLYASVLEGVLFNLFQCYKVMCETNGEPDVIKLSGGVLNSLFWRQMCADIMGHNLEVNNNKHSSLMGAAKLGLQSLGESDTRRAEQEKREIIPFREELHRYYMERYDKYIRYFEMEL